MITPEEFAVESPADTEMIRAAFLVLSHAGMAVVRKADSLDAAWAEAEAALPEGWHVQELVRDLWSLSSGEVQWAAAATKGLDEYPNCQGQGPTPVAALGALAARLREMAENMATTG